VGHNAYKLFVRSCKDGATDSGADGMGKGPQRQLRSSHLGSHRPLTLQLGLVSVEGLLSAVLQIRAVMVLRESMLNEVHQSKPT